MGKSRSVLYKTIAKEFYLLITITLFGCSQNEPDRQDAFKKENTQKPPVTITGKAPFVTLLDTCPAPSTIAIPQKMADSYNIKTEDGAKTIRLLPPETKSVGFFVSMQNFTTRDGLIHNNVGRACVDKHGNLWFCSWTGGVSRYDGRSFTNYTTVQGLVSNSVNSVYEDKAGDMWFGTDGGVSRYDGKSFKSYTTAQGLANNSVPAITEDKNGDIWFGTGRGLSRLDRDGKSFHNDTTVPGFRRDYVSCMLQDKSGTIWFGTWGDGGVSSYDGKSYSNYTAADGLANNSVISICQDTDGNIWFGNAHGKISFLDINKKITGERVNFTSYSIAEGLRGHVQTITEDKNGNLWFGTDDGACRLDRDKKWNPGKEDFTSITARQGLPGHNVTSILADKSGNIWFGMDDGGVSLLNRDLKSLTSLTTNEVLLSTFVSSVLEDKAGDIWVGTVGEGALRLSRDGKSLKRYTTSQGLPANEIIGILQDKKDNVWISTFGGICRLSSNGKCITRYTADQGFPENYVQKILEDKHGNLWFGRSIGGAYRFNPDSKSIAKYTTDQGLPDSSVTNIFEDKKGNIWIGTQKGVSRIGPDGTSFTNYTIEHGLTNNFVTGILEDKNGNLWFGSDGGGVSRYDGQSFASFTTSQGLPADQVRDIVMDKEGIIWLGTNKGFTAIKGFVPELKDTLNDPGLRNLQPSNQLSNAELERNNFKPVFEIYNAKTGYPIEAITSNLLVTQEGIIWSGIDSREKTLRFDYSSIHKNPNAPPVVIQGVKINNEAISWNDLNNHEKKSDSFLKTPNGMEEVTQFGKLLDEDQRQAMRKKFSAIKFDSVSRFYPVPVNLVLPYGYNNITFEFRAIEPARPGLVRYQYMMDGYEEEWSPVSDKTNATYGNIHEGTYTFKLKAQSPDGVWSRPLTYTFKVLPPWYRTWWFIIPAVGCLVTLFYSLIRWRLQQRFRVQLERSEKEKQLANLRHKTGELEMQALRAQMNPHFIFNCLSSINHYILKNDSEMASEYLTKFSRLIRMVLNNSKNPLINLEDELEMLRLYIDLERLRFNNTFDYSINFYNHFDISSIFIPPLILQPFAENAIWHGLMNKKEQGLMEVAFELDNGVLNCYITDNGIGRKNAETLKSKSAEKQKSMGMQITAERLALFNSEGERTIFKVEDLVDASGRAAGTRVTLKIRYKETSGVL
jgi:ligand-binding sensor domain-containing protein